MSGYSDRARGGLRVDARNLGVDEKTEVDEKTAEGLMVERADRDYVTQACEAAGGLSWNGDALTDRDRSI